MEPGVFAIDGAAAKTAGARHRVTHSPVRTRAQAGRATTATTSDGGRQHPDTKSVEEEDAFAATTIHRDARPDAEAIESRTLDDLSRRLQASLELNDRMSRQIEALMALTKPLERLLMKNAKFVWEKEANNAFEEIKRAFREASSLYIIKSERRFGMYVDASKYGLGAMLYQYEENDPQTEYVVAYASRSLKGAELNYIITELECLALVWALRKWYANLLGRQVRVNTDHRALKFLSACADDSSRIARWLAFLQEFDLEIEHIPGSTNIVADTLSRQNVKNGYVKKEDAIKRIARQGGTPRRRI
ncbi:Retrovirus-related Pol polyprotein from transposon 17.6 [Camponotus floridanus]|uniref:Retrovirus-related Pol polyprotein from transposon 17.6 n=1 Tax=Camponotus floridanus TaxID=104421 RepID=E2A7V6_CAMFO|nr:Retrovirus-related Pol polyprotein from transposon 17.6 [Camponotus floridanus]